jgi:nucleoside-diphosphate-sugar epimerase
MSTQSVFMTGATGAIGRRVVQILVAQGHRVTAVGRSPEKREALERAGGNAIAVDLLDRKAIVRAVQGHETVINLVTHIPPSSRALVPGAWRENNRVRREVAAGLASAALSIGVGRFIQESFAHDAGDAWIDESSPVRAARYNRAALDAEAAAGLVTREGGAGIVLRFAYLYGADSDFTQDAVRYVRRGRAPVFGVPSAFISSVSHDDAASAVVAALKLPAGPYDVCDNQPVRRQEFVTALAAALEVPPPRFFPAWVAALAGSLGETLSRSQRISNMRHRLRQPVSQVGRPLGSSPPQPVDRQPGDHCHQPAFRLPNRLPVGPLPSQELHLVRAGQRDGSIRSGDPRLLALTAVAHQFFLRVGGRILQDALVIDRRDPKIQARIVEHVIQSVRRALASGRGGRP